MIVEGFRHSSGAHSVRGSRGKTRLLRTTHYVALGIALVLAAMHRQHCVARSGVRSIGGLRPGPKRPGDEGYDGQPGV